MSHLHRELAPISDTAWGEIEKEARRTLRTFLAARQVVDFSGPHGWDYSAESLGRPDPDLAKVIDAAKRAALAEDHTVFNGFKEAHITGIAEASPQPGIEIG